MTDEEKPIRKQLEEMSRLLSDKEPDFVVKFMKENPGVEVIGHDGAHRILVAPVVNILYAIPLCEPLGLIGNKIKPEK